MATEYWKDDELQEFGQDILEKYHEDLHPARVLFVFRDPPGGKGDKTEWGHASRVPSKWKQVAKLDADFLIVIAWEVWERINAHQKAALIDHELCHCHVEKTDKGDKIQIVPHDFSEFHKVLRRHGAWDTCLENMSATVKQYVLPGLEEGEDTAEDGYRVCRCGFKVTSEASLCPKCNKPLLQSVAGEQGKA